MRANFDCARGCALAKAAPGCEQPAIDLPQSSDCATIGFMQRIVIVGPTGAGKTCLGRRLASRDSLFIWALKSQPRQRREYPHILAQPDYRHLHVLRFRNPCAVTDWMEEAAIGETAAPTPALTEAFESGYPVVKS